MMPRFEACVVIVEISGPMTNEASLSVQSCAQFTSCRNARTPRSYFTSIIQPYSVTFLYTVIQVILRIQIILRKICIYAIHICVHYSSIHISVHYSSIYVMCGGCYFFSPLYATHSQICIIKKHKYYALNTV